MHFEILGHFSDPTSMKARALLRVRLLFSDANQEHAFVPEM